ncbi:MAG: hypothetical protein ACXV6M_14310 [Ilumatobacteraceae bacterium]
MTTTTYCTEQELLDHIKSNADIGNDATIGAVESASRAIDSYCSRRFYSVSETRYFSPDFGSQVGFLYILELHDSDLANLTDLTVLSGQGGTYSTTWTSGTDFIAEPLNRQPGWPYTRLRGITNPFPQRLTLQAQETVKITGNFGWDEVPAPVKLATKLLAAQYYKLGDAPLGVAGWGAYGEIRVREMPQVATLLAPYRKGSMWGIG